MIIICEYKEKGYDIFKLHLKKMFQQLCFLWFVIIVLVIICIFKNHRQQQNMKNFVIYVLDTILFNFLPLSIILLKWDYLSNYRNKIHLGGYSHRWSIIGGCWYNDHRSWNYDRFPSLVSSPGPKVQVNYCHHLASVVRRLLSVNFSHFKLLLRNHGADWNQT